jgi:hypothetical protein
MTGSSLWIESSSALDQLFAAHAACTAQLRNAPRTCTSHFAKKDKQGNPIPDYADLATIFDVIRPALAAHKLSITQSFAPFGSDGNMMLVTTLGHASGQFQRSFLPMKGNVPPQQLAAAATYLKRVALCALVGIAADDDDDGVVANGTHNVAAVNDERIVEERATKAIKDAPTPEARKKVLAHAEKLAGDGSLPPAALKRLQELSDSEGQSKAVSPPARKAVVAAS